jgi:hypothetical protein
MRLLVALAGFAATIGLAAPAHADAATDANFLAALNNAGITYKSGPDATAIGQRACQLMDQGYSQDVIVKGMTDQNQGLTTDTATKFMQIAENVYCPQHTGGAVPWPPPPPVGPTIPPYFPWPFIPSL